MKREEYQNLYKQKLKSLQEVAGMLKDGSVCASDIALARTTDYYKAVAARMESGELKNVIQHTFLDLGNAPFFKEEFADTYHGISWFSGGFARKGVAKGYTDVMPCNYGDAVALFRDYAKPNVLVTMVSPMDKHGYFSCGCSASVSPALLDTAKEIYLEVNEHMPRSLSGPQIHISQVTALWENHKPLISLPKTEIDEISAKIGALIAEQIPDGATLQLGVGMIPDAVGSALKDKKHLGIHTEMLTDSMIDLIECGAVDNSMKPIHRGKTVATFALGSQRMYDYIDDNPMVELLPVDYVNNPEVIAQHPDFISINAALEVDFYGQVCAESVGFRHISGTGGQTEYVRGAVKSPGGKSYICFASTAKDETISKIRPMLTPGAQVTTSKNDVDCIVTEYGIAELRGKTLSQRTKNLIAIAHPKFREELIFEAKKNHIII